MNLNDLQAPRRMAVLSIATSLVTLALKFGAYFLTGSVSLLSDALEAFVNLAAGMIALGALTIAARPADADHSYGHDKAEYFASGVEGVLILFAAGSIVYAAVPRLFAPQPLEHLGIGLGIAVIAAAANYATARLMLDVARRHDSITIEADAQHLMTDVWTTAAVVAGLLIVWFMPAWHILDPLLAVAVAVHIVATGIDLLRRSTNGLMDSALPAEEIERIERVIGAHLPPQAKFQAMRTRKSGARRFIEFNLLVPGATAVRDAHGLCDRLEDAIQDELPNASVLIHVEPGESRGGAAAHPDALPGHE
jgi:cation diffusion facilitator family transporter